MPTDNPNNVPEAMLMRWLLSEMVAELRHPSERVSGTEGGWPAFVDDWCDRANEFLLVGPSDADR